MRKRSVTDEAGWKKKKFVQERVIRAEELCGKIIKRSFMGGK